MFYRVFCGKVAAGTSQNISANIYIEIKTIYHRSPIQTEKFKPEGKRIMPETRFTEFPASSVNPRVGISWPASETDDVLFFSHLYIYKIGSQLI